MSKFIVNMEELDELAEFFSKHGLDYTANKLKLLKNPESPLLDIQHLYLFNSKAVHKNTELIKSLYEYTKDKFFNIAHVFESEVLKGYTWGTDFEGYMRLIKNTDYYLKENDKLYSVIQKQPAHTNNAFWGLVSLATLIQDNSTCTQAFYLILKDKLPSMYSFGLLELEKIKKVWDKRFKGVDINTLPNDEHKFIKESFSKISASKTKSFCTSSSGNYLSIMIDIDLISQENKKSKNINGEVLGSFFRSFSEYIKENPDDKNQLSLTRITYSPDGYDIELILYYSDISHTATIKSVIDDLISYAIVKRKDGLLQANVLKEQNPKQFFSTFIMNHLLENSLDKKIETKTKKNKI